MSEAAVVKGEKSLVSNKTHSELKFSKFVRICHNLLFCYVTNGSRFCCCLFAFVVSRSCLNKIYVCQ